MKKKKVQYHKLTFLLSVVGTIGSLGFYFGVLRQVYGSDAQIESDKIKQNITLLKDENKELNQAVQFLIKELKEDEELATDVQ